MLSNLLNSVVRHGQLTVILPDNSRRTYGRGAPEVAVKLHDNRAVFELALRPDLKLGELYMDGRLTVEEGDITALLDLLMTNLAQRDSSSVMLFLTGAGAG